MVGKQSERWLSFVSGTIRSYGSPCQVMHQPADAIPTFRPERADKIRNRARILEAAAAVFGATGMETSMDDVAARAGVAVGTLYRHFATKDALMAAMARRHFSMQTLIDRAQAAGTMRADVSADDVPMLMCGVSASIAFGDWNWRRHLEIVLTGLSQAAADSEVSPLPDLGRPDEDRPVRRG
jgi:AcrR family transcriptional regulator